MTTLIDIILLCTLEQERNCPECGESDCLDSGFGFGMRDYECSECDFSISFDGELYALFLSLLP